MSENKCKLYKCECSKEFVERQSFNGHKCHCEIHLKATGKYDRIISIQKTAYAKSRKTYFKNKVRRDEEKQKLKSKKLEDWVSEQHTCEHCGKVMTEKFGSGRFCSNKCSHSRVQTKSTNEKRSQTLQVCMNSPEQIKKRKNNTKELVKKYKENPNYCKVCGKKLPYEKRRRKTCSKKCKNTILSISGRKSAEINKSLKRSRNEVYFYNLCVGYFKSVRHNMCIFNGWDADIIIDDYKIAVLWNGPWHYKQVIENQVSSLKQIQTRDKLKLKAIESCGYIPYVIKDTSKHKERVSFVENEFQKFLDYIRKYCII